MTQVFERADSIFFDDTSRYVFFSDLHRGDSSRSDAFARNEDLFVGALRHYYRSGFTYVEVGDGDELWQNRRFGAVRRAHRRTFDLLHEFDRRDRLHLIFGNHDIQGRQRHRMKKDGLIAQEGLILEHTRTGQRIFVVHGHQVDFKSDYLYWLSRFATRHFWRHVQNLGFGDGPSRETEGYNRETIRQRIVEWVRMYDQSVICGHTHTPKFAAQGSPPYFNAGSCVFAGHITGLEIRDGEIALVKWSRENGNGINRGLMAPPRRLRTIT